MFTFNENPLINRPFTVGSIGDYQTHLKEEAARQETIRNDPRYVQWKAELDAYVKAREDEEAREEKEIQDEYDRLKCLSVTKTSYLALYIFTAEYDYDEYQYLVFAGSDDSAKAILFEHLNNRENDKEFIVNATSKYEVKPIKEGIAYETTWSE